jgi:hypothetical protein
MIGSSMGGLVRSRARNRCRTATTARWRCAVPSRRPARARDRLLGLLVAFDYFYPGQLAGAPLGFAPRTRPDLSEARLERALADDPDQGRAARARFGSGARTWPATSASTTSCCASSWRGAAAFPVDNREVATPVRGRRRVQPWRAPIRADPRAAEYLRLHYTPSGRVAHPVMLLETSYDPTVPAEAAERYLDLVRAAGNESLVISRRVPGEGHCRFDADQVGSAFDDLVGWVRVGVLRAPAAPCPLGPVGAAAKVPVTAPASRNALASSAWAGPGSPVGGPPP